MKAAVLGGSGEVGKQVVSTLISDPDFAEVLLVGRRELDQFKDVSKIKQVVVNLDNIYEEALPHLQGYTVGFNTMGVGKPSKVSKEELTRVDLTIPSEFARACKQSGVSQMSILTSTGADPTAKSCFVTGTAAGGGLYLGLKGKVEENTKALAFDHVHIFRPGALLGNANTPALVDWLSGKVGGLVPNKYREIHITDLGRAMVTATKRFSSVAGPTVNTWEGGDIIKAFPKEGDDGQ